MHSLIKTTCPRQIFALAKPHDSGSNKKTRNRIPKEERKILVESFIKKHQESNNGVFPSLSLTHREVGGSFYTIREIVREIIQENRVLGAGDFVPDGKGSDPLIDQSVSVLIDPVPPLSLPPNGFHSASDQNCKFSTEVGEDKSPGNRENVVDPGEKGPDSLNFEEVNATQLLKEDVGRLVHQSMSTIDISKTQFEASCSEENDTNHYAGLHDSATKPQDNELNVDNKDRGFEEMPFIESEGTEAINNDERVNDAGTAMANMANLTNNTAGTTDLLAEVVVEAFPVRSVTSTMESSDVHSSEVDKVSESEIGTEAKVETDRSNITSVDLGEISSSISAVPEEQGTDVNAGQKPNNTSAPVEKNVEERFVNPASIDVECANPNGTVVTSAVIGSIHETKEFNNGTLTTEQTMPTLGNESGSSTNGIPKVEAMSSHARNEVAAVEKADMEKGKLDVSDSSSSHKGNIATLNRIKPESWKGQSNVARQETNPLLAALKSFLTAFVKFWSE